jgi:hypothetical protein
VDLKMNNTHGAWMLGSCLFLAASTASADGLFFAADRFTEMSALPGTSLGAPTGMVASSGSAFVGIGGIKNPDSNDTDGSFIAGMGFGNAMDSIGATASVTIGSINTSDNGFGERAALNVSVGKFFTDDQIGIAIGAVNLASKNDLTDTPDPSYFAAVTKVFPIENHPIILNIGLGSNDFVNTSYTGSKKMAMTPFASVGYYVSPQVSLIADNTAGVGSLGVSISPVHTLPLTLTLGAYDIDGGTDRSYTAAIGYAFTY